MYISMASLALALFIFSQGLAQIAKKRKYFLVFNAVANYLSLNQGHIASKSCYLHE